MRRNFNFLLKNVLAVLLVSVFFMSCLGKKFVYWEAGDSIVKLSRKISKTLDENRSIIGEQIVSAQTIYNSGWYFLANNITGAITIDADNVVLNLNNRQITDSLGTVTAITVESGHKNITIKNGSLRGFGSGSSSSGILVKGGSRFVQVEDLHILDFDNGIYFDGVSTLTVKSCMAKNCLIKGCNKGIVLDSVLKSVFQNCKTYNCTESGFELEDSWYNVFERCKALETSNGDLEKSAVGFKSTSGRGNLFIECVAEGTTKTAGNFGFNAAGFLLTGSDNKAGETETKIINCCVDSTDTTLTGSCVAYGVQLDMVLKPNSLDASRVAAQATKSSNQWAVSWSKEADYIAVGGDDNIVRVYFFNGSSLTTVASVSGLPADVLAVDWSPQGNFLAVGLDSNGTGEVFVYRFDPLADSSSRLSLVDSLNLGGSAYGLSWSPDGRYLAMVLRQTDPLEVRVFAFDGTNGFSSLLGSATLLLTELTQTVSFSPDGKFLLCNELSGLIVLVYSFNPFLSPNALQLVASKSLSGFSFTTIARFSPISFGDEYFILVGDRQTPGKIAVFSFDGQSTISGPLDSTDHGEAVAGLRWSPNGKYIVLTGIAGTGGFEMRVFSFDGSQLTLESSGDHATTTATSADWSSSGKYVAIVGFSATNNIQIFDVANVCSKNVIENNKISNCQGGLGGIGIEGASATNLIIKNIGYENGVNFSSGVFNQYRDGLITGTYETAPGLLDNISVPPY